MVHGQLRARAANPIASQRLDRTVFQTRSEKSKRPPDVLQWLVNDRGAAPGHLKVAVQRLAGLVGRGLIALEDAPPGEVLLSVPFTSVFMDEETDESSHLPWSARMGMRLLAMKRQCDSGDAVHGMCPWIASLPASVPLPILHFSGEEIEACQDADTMREAQSVQEAARASAEDQEDVLAALGYGWEHLQWAMSVLNSRCFTLGSPSGALHLTVPGVDMANHSFQPNAAVRVQHSPDAVQGLHAVEEVCEPQQAAPSRFELVAGEAGIRPGEEITISYGAWSNEVFFLFFGFVPDASPWDAVTLFQTLKDMVSFHDSLQAAQSSESASGTAASIEAALTEQHGITDWRRLAVMPAGYDRRTALAAEMVLAVHGERSSPASALISPGDLLAKRCQQLLDDYPTTLEHDMEVLKEGTCSAATACSVRYRMGKKQTLTNAITGMQVEACGPAAVAQAG